HGAFMRSALLDMPPIMPTTACHQSNDVERYRRYSIEDGENVAGRVGREARATWLVRRCWAKRNATRPKNASYDHHPSTCARLGSSALNRGYDAHHRSIRRCRICEGRPRRFGGVQRGGGTWNANSSRTVQP